MRLEPVYLVAPEPEPPKVTRRAAILGALLAAGGGLVAGGFIGSVVRSERTSSPEPGRDPDLLWLRGLESADAAALASAFPQLISVLERRSDLTAEVWTELARVADELLAGRLNLDSVSEWQLARRFVELTDARDDVPPDLMRHRDELLLRARK